MKDKHIHIPEDRELLKEINRDAKILLNKLPKKKGVIVFKFFFYFSAIITFYGLLLKTDNPYLFTVSFVLYGCATLLLAFNFAHDFSHGTIFRNKFSDNAGFIFIYALNGAHAEAWKLRHIHSHHYAPNVKDYDSDLRITQLIRIIPGSDFKWYHRFQHIYAPVLYITYSLYWVLIKDVVLLFSKDEFNNRKGFICHLSFWLQKIFYAGYLLLVPLIFSGQSWQLVVFSFLLMHAVQSLFLLFTFFMTHHVESTAYPVTDKNGFIQTSWLMNQVKSSNDMHPFSKTANFIFGGFNNHIAHHLFPHVHHVYYPELSKLLYRKLEEHGTTPNETTYFGGIISHLRFLKKMNREEKSSVRLLTT